MDVLLLAARVLLALVFGVAGATKLVDRPGSRQTLREFGVPGWLTGPLSVGLPVAELGVALALLPAVSAWWGALGAVSLLLVFMVAIGFSLLRGRQPACHCFGQLHSAPVGWLTLARNGALVALAAVLAVNGPGHVGPSAFSWVDQVMLGDLILPVGGLIIVGVLAAEAWLLVQLVAQNGRLLVKLEAFEAKLGADDARPTAAPALQPQPGLPVGSSAPEFTVAGLYGETLTLGALRAAGQPVLLLFTDPECGPCQALLPEVGRWQREWAGQLTLATISRGTAEANLRKSAEHGISNVLLQQDREVAERYQVFGTPSAVVVQADGRIASPLAAGADAIRSLVARASALATSAGSGPVGPDPALVVGPSAGLSAGQLNGQCPGCGQHHLAAGPIGPAGRAGEPVPPLQLSDLAGKAVDLAASRGHKTLVLFWNPSCGFCQEMLADLRRWDGSPPRDAPKLVVVSTGTAEANRALAIRAPVLLDQSFSAGRAFGVTGTPSAVLVDGDGKIASQVGVGASGVWALAGGLPSSSNGNALPVLAPTS